MVSGFVADLLERVGDLGIRWAGGASSDVRRGERFLAGSGSVDAFPVRARATGLAVLAKLDFVGTSVGELRGRRGLCVFFSAFDGGKLVSEAVSWARRCIAREH